MPIEFELTQVSMLSVDSSLDFIYLFAMKSEGGTVIMKFNQIRMQIKLNLMQSIDTGLNNYLKANQANFNSALLSEYQSFYEAFTSLGSNQNSG